VTGDSSPLASNADLLRSVIAGSNVTVLTSSTTNEFSREDEKWNNGAFTKVLLDALGKEADENHDGLVSMSELTHYVATQVSSLTGGQQHPGVEQRYEGDSSSPVSNHRKAGLGAALNFENRRKAEIQTESPPSHRRPRTYTVMAQNPQVRVPTPGAVPPIST
jgi:hypothetical protein